MISTGRASVGARTTNTENASWDHKTSGGDQDLQSINSKIYSQPLKDEAVLTFDIVPTVSGNVYFRWVMHVLAALQCCCQWQTKGSSELAAGQRWAHATWHCFLRYR